MKYLCLAFGDEAKSNAMTPAAMDDLIAKCQAYDAELRASGHLVGGMSLGWGATTLRLQGGKLSVTDGPFSATKEVVGGLVVIEAENLDEAVRIASMHPAARMGEELGWGIELRPVEDMPACRPDSPLPAEFDLARTIGA